jgi:hypothetical protein
MARARSAEHGVSSNKVARFTALAMARAESVAPEMTSMSSWPEAALGLLPTN